MRLLCETVVNDILPAVRALIAKELEERGYSQTEIAELLDITQPAVSQYLTAARGREVQRIEQHDAAYTQVQDLIDRIVADAPDEELSRAFCDTCLSIRESGLFDAAFDGSEDMDAACCLRDS
ncbi:MAG: helix-turn-helix domain-containing protein [Candidatus Nanohaloarchaea archaeon]|nr:helix-turn-helix domain-containing protein [Candidatus Nanohaloarchaea archaeon]